LPWYFNGRVGIPVDKSSQPFTLTYIGRVAPEKGVHQIFEALEMLTDLDPLTIRIAGAIDSGFARNLQNKYPRTIKGIHTVEWLGWSDVSSLFCSTDVSLIPSQHIDNTPLSLIESFAHSVPVVATRIPTIIELVHEGETGYLFDFDSAPSLAKAIRRAYAKKISIRGGTAKYPKILTLEDYLTCVVAKYRTLLSNKAVV
jgi:glycosyltransferase involved in cell wall biosynthesis